MNETPRVAALVSELAPCASLADVGCDHGYCTLAALERGLCARAVVTDISARSLQKAERLLAPYIAQGRVQSVCCDGLAGVPADTEQVLIAGMGGEEIVTILTRGFLPPRLVLQPMKNAPKVRRFLVEAGYRLEHDYTLFVGRKYYDIVRAAVEIEKPLARVRALAGRGAGGLPRAHGAGEKFARARRAAGNAFGGMR